jgi:hypothetical protein
MNMLHLAETEDTPEVRYHESESTLVIRGKSLPENAFNFYSPVLDWAKSLAGESLSNFTIELYLEYFNSSTGRYLLELFLAIADQHIPQKKIVWLVEADDELMIEKGEEFSSLIKIPFEIRTI